MALKAGIQLSVDKKGNLKVIDLVRGDVRKLNAETRRSTVELRKMRKQSQANAASLQNLGTKAKFAGGALLAAFGVGNLASDILRVGNAVNGFESNLTATFGTLEAGKGQLEFVREEANRLGLEYLTLAKNYSGWSAATERSTLAGETQREIFSSIAESARVMNLSVDDTNGVFRALTQIISKGKVQAEELRGQMGERIPGAFQIAAKSMGLTTAELDKALKDGKVYAEEFLPNFAKELRNTFGGGLDAATNNLQANTNRIKNGFEQLQEIAFDGVEDSLNDLAGSFADTIADINASLASGEFEANLSHWEEAMHRAGNTFGDIFGSDMAGVVSETMSGIKELFYDLPVIATEVATMLYAEINNVIQDIKADFDLMGAHLDFVWDGVGAGASVAWGVVRVAAAETKNYVAQVMAQMLTDIGNAIAKLPKTDSLVQGIFGAAGTLAVNGAKLVEDANNSLAQSSKKHADAIQVHNNAIDDHTDALKRNKEFKDLVIAQSFDRILSAKSEREAQIELNKAFAEAEAQFQKLESGGFNAPRERGVFKSPVSSTKSGSKKSKKPKKPKLTDAEKQAIKDAKALAKEKERLNQIILDSEQAYNRANILLNEGSIAAETYDYVLQGVNETTAKTLALKDQQTEKLNEEYELREKLKQSFIDAKQALEDEYDQLIKSPEAWYKAQLAAEGYDAAQVSVLSNQHFVNESIKESQDFYASLYDSAVQSGDGIKGVWKSIGDTVVSELQRMAKEKLLSGLFGDVTAAGGRDGGLFGDIFGGFLGLSPSRANGGAVYGGGINEIVERGEPETLTTKGRTYLLSASDGNVQPLQSVSSNSNSNNQQGSSPSGKLAITVDNLENQRARVTSASQAEDGTLQVRMIIETTKSEIFNDASRGKGLAKVFEPKRLSR